MPVQPLMLAVLLGHQPKPRVLAPPRPTGSTLPFPGHATCHRSTRRPQSAPCLRLSPWGSASTPPCTLSPSQACQLASLVSGPEGCCLPWAPQAWPSKRWFKGEYSRLVPKFCSCLGGSRPKSAPGSSADSLLAGLAPGAEEGHPWRRLTPRLHSNSASLGRGPFWVARGEPQEVA